MIKTIAFFFVIGITSLSFAQKKTGFSGYWETTFGPMNLETKGATVNGKYNMGGIPGIINGELKKSKLIFTYTEPNVAGEGWFELDKTEESFSGQWRPKGTSKWMTWVGQRADDPAETFSGVWHTAFGPMRLFQNESNTITGIYAGGGTVIGKIQDRKFSFKYQDGSGTGEGWFKLDEQGQSFKGEWVATGKKEWKEWNGVRKNKIPGKTWLFVLEARWELTIEDKEYAFGDMLKSFFDRTPNVEVRRRNFTDSKSLKRWLDEIAFIPEPTVISISSHGETDGIKVDGNTVPVEVFAESLKLANNVKVLHFSSCLIMKNDFGQKVFNSLRKAGNKAAVSGYKTSVDWSNSAVFEMAYFDLLLSKRLSPDESAATVLRLFPLAGDKNIPQLNQAPLGFKLLN